MASFQNRMNDALRSMKRVLENNREPSLAENVAHSYQDKYSLAEFLANSFLSAHIASLDVIGANISILAKLKEWSKSRSVTLRLRGEETCKYLREETRKVESTQHVSERESSLFGKSTRTDKIVTTITEYFWQFTVNYELIAFQGTNVADCVSLRTRKGECEIKTSSNKTPKPQVSVLNDIDVNVTWYLSQFNDNMQANFSIDRSAKTCHTPRRNAEIEAAINFSTAFFQWCQNVENYFLNRLFPVETAHGYDLSAISAGGLFVPVFPIMESRRQVKTSNSTAGGPDEEDEQTVIIPHSDVCKFMAEQKRALAETISALNRIFPGSKLITQAEASIVLSLKHSRNICEYFIDGVNYIEDMLRKQLVAAIGKEVRPADLVEFMEYHSRKLFKQEYAPQKFCYSVRRPDHYPEGVLGIEAQDGTPVPVLAHKVPVEHPMKFAINAATTVTFHGARYIHAWVDHTFSGSSGTSLRLSARARQFSSFILVIGNIISANSFNPKHAIILQNKDDLLIQLLLEQIPTPKAFRDAIESLSPEQQRFAKAFRSMQLESSLFGVCIIQIKPQLEKLLCLPNDSLTKEIKLTQELMELFLKYQVPSDLLSYDGDANQPLSVKIARVKQLVCAMNDMISAAKQKEIEEARQKAEYERQQRLQAAVPKAAPSRYSRGAAFGDGGGGPRLMSVACAAPAAPQRQIASMVPNFSAPKMASALQRSAAPAPVMAKSRSSMVAPTPNAAPAPKPSAPKPSAPKPKPVSVPAPTPAKPVQVDAPPSTPVPQEKSYDNDKGDRQVEEGNEVDFTKLPTMLDASFEKLDLDAALHTTILSAGLNWTKKEQQGLLGAMKTVPMNTDKQKEERNRAFDLLDALTRSGVLDIDEAEFHVVLAATHCFDKTLMDTLVQQNVNPIEKLERSMLIIASTITQTPPEELVNPEYLPILQQTSPNLFE